MGRTLYGSWEHAYIQIAKTKMAMKSTNCKNEKKKVDIDKTIDCCNNMDVICF